MKDYMNNAEEDVWLISVLAASVIEDAMPKMRANLLSKEARALNTSVTNIRNAYNSKTERLNANATKKLYKRAGKSCIEVLSKEQSKIISKKEDSKKSEMVVDIDILSNIASELIRLKCENCNTKCGECYTYGLLKDIDFIGYEERDNCPYSFSSHKEEVKAKKPSKRRQKKDKNKYDDDGEIYEYNLDRKLVK
ncbi:MULTISPECIES: DUF5651 domain-containing protein [Clostridia]|uniref:DUF5651 domain-containing protein n=1 Tax=Clostridia TaxID=186801 RepID=UPI002A8D608A|nr:DUF5651 domain-containing protein [Peptostreptococcus porci]MDY5098709.1 DUF5651 domain-containing protein [Clostridium sp.]MDY5437484.1 DUF5651 domain-containing protein [Peptostreptococcus porci]